MTHNQQTAAPGTEQYSSHLLADPTSDLLLEEPTDAPLNPYARVFVVSWLLGTLIAVGVPYLFQ
ncbi:hypothetical protein J2I47_17175 [Fibrella sp. HMF5335]|uniref:Uncharacterized protein n=1 Tax=Fibrella rubiginis TaxID=2817060 RepID=A0A939GK81_9BACT|nr:hypothetical protein [Fibrella rubiginis]MBO0938286.1 hypothetical protein [Fibrella rubiginis]